MTQEHLLAYEAAIVALERMRKHEDYKGFKINLNAGKAEIMTAKTCRGNLSFDEVKKMFGQLVESSRTGSIVIEPDGDNYKVEIIKRSSIKVR